MWWRREAEGGENVGVPVQWRVSVAVHFVRFLLSTVPILLFDCNLVYLSIRESSVALRWKVYRKILTLSNR